MKTIHSSIAGPFRHENLEIFILRGPETITDQRCIPLHEAMQAQTVTVHETGSVGQLEVENHGEDDLYIQAGDVVKGGAPGPHTRSRSRGAFRRWPDPDPLLLRGSAALAPAPE